MKVQWRRSDVGGRTFSVLLMLWWLAQCNGAGAVGENDTHSGELTALDAFAVLMQQASQRRGAKTTRRGRLEGDSQEVMECSSEEDEGWEQWESEQGDKKWAGDVLERKRRGEGVVIAFLNLRRLKKGSGAPAQQKGLWSGMRRLKADFGGFSDIGLLGGRGKQGQYDRAYDMGKALTVTQDWGGRGMQWHYAQGMEADMIMWKVEQQLECTKGGDQMYMQHSPMREDGEGSKR